MLMRRLRRIARVLSFLGPLGVVVLALSKVSRRQPGSRIRPTTTADSFRFAWSLGYALALTIAAYGLGLPELTVGWRRSLTAAAGAAVVSALVVSLAQLVVGDALLPRFVVFGVALITVPLHAVAVAVARFGQARSEARDRVLFVGGDTERARLAVDIELTPERPSVLVGALEVAEAARSGDQRSSPLVELALAQRASVVVLDRRAQDDDQVIDQVAVLHETGLRIRSLTQFYEEWLAKLPISELERTSMFFDISEIHQDPLRPAKRLVDLVGALVGLVVLVVVTPLVLIGNLVANRGPMLYRQQRVGRWSGRSFEILKFRSRWSRPALDVVDAQLDRTADDPRITPFGRLLRSSHLDELPQVVNVLRGDSRSWALDPSSLTTSRSSASSLPFYRMRHLVRPGLTGWAQVKYGYAGDERDAIEKLQYEFFYLRYQSLRFDLRVIVRTVRSVIGTAGR